MESMALQFLPLTVICAFLFFAFSFTNAGYDNSPLQNFCVADYSSTVNVNGRVCKQRSQVTIEDFSYSGLNIRGNTNNPLGFTANVADVNKLPGLNTLGISMIRVDFAPNGVGIPHVHPRASEISVVLEGSIYAGFVDSYPGIPGTKSKVYAKTFNPGDVFVVPIGLVHFAYNIGKTNASAISAFNSQDFGFIRIPGDIFGTDPPISPDLLAKAFQMDTKEVEHFQTLKW